MFLDHYLRELNVHPMYSKAKQYWNKNISILSRFKKKVGVDCSFRASRLQQTMAYDRESSFLSQNLMIVEASLQWLFACP